MTTSFGTLTLAMAIENWRETLWAIAGRGYLAPDVVLSALGDIVLDAGVDPVEKFPLELLMIRTEAKRRCENKIEIDFTITELVKAANAALSKLARS